jgi:hypothetical protein
MAEPKPRTRNTEAAAKDKIATLILYCNISIDVIGVMQATPNESMKEFFRGQSDALKAVLRHLGVEPRV